LRIYFLKVLKDEIQWYFEHDIEEDLYTICSEYREYRPSE